MSKTTVDLKPPELVLRELRQGAILKWARFGAPLVVLILVASGAFIFAASRAEISLENLRMIVATERSNGEQIAPLASRLRRANREHGSYQAVLTEPPWTHLLSDIAAAALGEVNITEIAMRKERLVAGARTETAVVTITGVAPSNTGVSLFIQKLEPSTYVKNLALEVSRDARSGPNRIGIEFEVVCHADEESK